MIIVYFSLVLVVASIALFIASSAKTAKQMNGSMGKIAKTAEKIREQSEKIAKEKYQLTQNLSAIQLDFFKKREKVQKATQSVKKSVILTQENFYKAKIAMKNEKA
ncbi:hypothetical protein [Sporolactobacillus putidus]|uniref:DUF948 domain-containing protein n=1 Tax=Sporolactobacillus putidus TaxID=492735 RepID=A0A917RZY8_9BACL|nr:hypothetical protein [Sporolactobacillus putidus]GGL46095.1 hypothetical protein GCM10007968_07750 [Sporolactobacillus putidus]